MTASKLARSKGSAPEPASAPNIGAEMTVPSSRATSSLSKAMTRRAATLDALEPAAVASVSRGTLRTLGIAAGDPIRVSTRRGAVELAARQDDRVPDGVVFIPFAYAEAAANLLTNPALDPFGKIPEFKYCAVKVSAGGAAPERVSDAFGGGRAINEIAPVGA